MTEKRRSADAAMLEALLEPIERRMYVDLYDALPAVVAEECGISRSVDAGALRLTCRAADHPFFNRVMGLGGGRDLGEWIDGLAAHYREAGVRRWMVQVAPSDRVPELEPVFAARGLVALRGWAKHAGRMTEVRSPLESEAFDLRVVPIGPERARDFASIAAPAFQFPAAATAWPAATVGRPGWRHYMAFDGDEPAACAALFVSGEVGTLTFAATREGYRRRGAQSALIAERLRDAREMGLAWVVTETDEDRPEKPNPSYRNIVRAGMPVRYVRANWGPPPPGTAS